MCDRGESISKLLFDKLTGENYGSWSSKMKMVMKDKGLYELCTGDETPSENAMDAQ